MITVKEIRELKEYLVKTYHFNRVKEQNTDQTYIDDTFVVPFVKKGIQVVRTGKGYRMVSAPAEHIITSNPQLFREHIKGTKDANDRVAKESNRWLKLMTRQVPQPFKQYVKYLLGRGEAWIYVVHNNDFDSEDVNNLPVNFYLIDPLVVFGDRQERGGVPKRIIISYDRIASDIRQNYPEWTWEHRKAGQKDTDKVPFFMYIDEDVRYFEGVDEALLREESGDLANGDGIQENIYGFVNLVHAYSGFGMGAVDGDPSQYAVGRLRYCRDKIAENTAIRSTLNSIIFRYAHKSVDLIYPADSGMKPSGDLKEQYNREPNSFNVIGVPTGTTIKASDDLLPDQQLFTHLYNTERDIDKEDPLGTVGGVIGTSGRQQDMAEEASLKRYDTIVENCAHAFSTAFGMAYSIIEKLDHLLPVGIKKGDINGDYNCRIDLAAEDPLSQDRLRTLGSRLYQQGEIDLETNLTKYQGFTVDEAQLIMAKILADNATRNNPLIAAIMGEQAAREIGMESQYEALKMQTKMAENTLPPVPKTGSEGGEPREGNIKTQTGREMMDMALSQGGQRRSPQ